MSYAKIYAAFSAGGVPEKEAAEAADTLISIKNSEIAAIRGDISAFRADVRSLNQRLTGAIASLDAKQTATTTGLDQHLAGAIHALDLRFGKLEMQNRITWGLLVAVLVLLLRLAWKQGAL